MLGRIGIGVLVGFVTFLVVWVVLLLLSAALPGVVINAWAWAMVLGVVAGFVYVFTGKKPNEL